MAGGTWWGLDGAVEAPVCFLEANVVSQLIAVRVELTHLTLGLQWVTHGTIDAAVIDVIPLVSPHHLGAGASGDEGFRAGRVICAEGAVSSSAAEAKGEKGQEGEQDEGLHGASLHGCCAQCSPWSPRDFIGCCDRRQGGAPQPCQGYFQHIRRGREPPGQAAIVVWGELSSPVTGQNPQGGKCGPRPVEIRWWALALPAWQHSVPTRP